jgi:hypothetical protein
MVASNNIHKEPNAGLTLHANYSSKGSKLTSLSNLLIEPFQRTNSSSRRNLDKNPFNQKTGSLVPVMESKYKEIQNIAVL